MLLLWKSGLEIVICGRYQDWHKQLLIIKQLSGHPSTVWLKVKFFFFQWWRHTLRRIKDRLSEVWNMEISTAKIVYRWQGSLWCSGSESDYLFLTCKRGDSSTTATGHGSCAVWKICPSCGPDQASDWELSVVRYVLNQYWTKRLCTSTVGA